MRGRLWLVLFGLLLLPQFSNAGELSFHDPRSDKFIRFEVEGIDADTLKDPTKRLRLQTEGNALVGSLDAARISGAKDADRENLRLTESLRAILAKLFPNHRFQTISVLEIQAPYQRR